jgi:hypothetical protein
VLAVLEDFERYLWSNGIPMAPEAIDRHFMGRAEASCRTLPDWRSRFGDVVEQRWDLISRYLRSAEIALLDGGQST